MQKKICGKCGTENLEDSIFCAECGTPLNSTAEQEMSLEQQQSHEPCDRKEQSSRKCPSCGEDNPLESCVCLNCGEELEDLCPKEPVLEKKQYIPPQPPLQQTIKEPDNSQDSTDQPQLQQGNFKELTQEIKNSIQSETARYPGLKTIALLYKILAHVIWWGSLYIAYRIYFYSTLGIGGSIAVIIVGLLVFGIIRSQGEKISIMTSQERCLREISGSFREISWTLQESKKQ